MTWWGITPRPDVFELVVDERAKPGVRYITD